MTWKSVGACACAVAILSGCDPIRFDPPSKVALADVEAAYDTSYCERMFECDCGTRVFASIEACMEHVRTQVAALEQPPDIEGISYDPYCTGEKIDAFDELECASVAAEVEDSCPRPCFIYHGEVSEGDLCKTTPSTVYSNCAKRWRCDVDSCEGDKCTGVCVDPCEPTGGDGPAPAGSDPLVCSTLAEIR